MESYKLLIKKSAAAELAGGIPKRDLGKIIQRIQGLADDPRPGGSRKLSSRNVYRIRQGDYRVVYRVDDAARTVEVVKIGHRSEIYRD
ncbi:MAG: type II toxin-antitoxin system RelE/ParE family toxin [Candidatus Aminicenantes bacterium]|nr:type II toxin-antitoxin system RelE/ParE family toxin [Candidatus Aminicenantes bacterium]